MEKDLNDSVTHDSSCLKEPETDKSFVGKVKSIINNTPLSKWFRRQDDNRSTIRRHDEVFEDEVCEMQPPSKRVKLPAGNDDSNCNNILFNEIRVNPITRNNTSNAKFNSFHEPVAGPSGIKSRKLLNSSTNITTSCARSTFSNNELLNGLKDSDSEESTSGYSSVPRIGSKEQVCGSQESSKQTSPLQNSPSNSRTLFHSSHAISSRSLFADRSPKMNTSLSSRRPSFNASTFGSPNFVDKTIATKKIINSPFYNGQTIYGGASAYGRSLGRSSQDLKTSLRNSVQIKPVNKTTENGNLVLGKTARRILDTIEQYNSPINDAKKIPIVSKKLRQDGLLTKYTGANPYIIRDSKVASNRELQVPSVSDLLKMKQRSRLQESTEVVKQIAASSKSNLNTEYYKISTTENEQEKPTGKVKTKVTASVRQKQSNKETVSNVNLNPVALPITTLPKFDLNIPPLIPAKKVPENTIQPVEEVQSKTLPSKSPTVQSSHKTVKVEKYVQIHKQTTTTTSTTTLIEYKFSDPLVIAENIKSLVAINNFKFSEPLCKKNKTDSSNNVTLNFKMPENKLLTLTPNKNKNNGETPVKTPTLLKTGSVMDILGKKGDNSFMEKFKPALGTWECSACMIRNQPEKTKCVACETPKAVPSKQNENKNGFGSQFKLSSDKWECSTCMVRNNNSDIKCVACSTPKPASSLATKKISSDVGISSGFGDKFKSGSNSWECPTCMIRNNNELTKCAACETPNSKATTTVPSSNFGNKYQPAANSWECTTCMVRNKEDASKCIACETPKCSPKSTSAGFGNSFTVKDDEWECAVCMVRNKTSNTKCQCCEAAKPEMTSKSTPVLETANDKKPIGTFNFGVDKASTSGFNFGIPATAAVLPKDGTNASSIFGENAKPVSAAPPTFSFGFPSTNQNKPVTAESAKSDTTTATPSQTSNPLLKPNEKLPEKAESAPNEFKFEVPTTSKNNQNKTVSEEKSTTSTLATSTTVTSIPTFNFKPAANGDISKPVTLFGNKTDTTSHTAVFNLSTVTKTNIFNFEEKPAPATTPSAPIVTAQSSQSASSKPIFKFGSSNHLSSEKTPTPSFGSTNSTAPSNGLVTTNTPFGPITTPGFIAPTTNSSEAKPFTFSAPATTAGEPANKIPLFSFGQSSGSAANTAPAKTSGFNFGATSPPTFNFIGGKTDTPSINSSAANMFGITPSGAGKNGTFNFGSMASSNNNQKAGFSFGAAVNSTATPSTQSGFNFGVASAATPAPSSGGFNFSGAPPTFNATAKRTFNFTDGNVTTFSAQPSTDGGLAVPRKIKRAVRRTQR